MFLRQCDETVTLGLFRYRFSENKKKQKKEFADLPVFIGGFP